MAENDQKQGANNLNGATPANGHPAEGAHPGGVAEAVQADDSGREAAGATSTEGAARHTAIDPAATVARLTEEKRELNDRMLRIAADFENYKRRTRRDMEEAGVRGMEGLLKEVLPVLDNLDRALTNTPKADADPLFAALHAGVGLVQKQFLGSLEKFQIKSFDAQGKPFDPALHEAVAQVDSDLPAGTVAVVYQRGYNVGARLLRPALVAVARARSGAAPEPKAAADAVQTDADELLGDGPGARGNG